jgi:hypothetical protein
VTVVVEHFPLDVVSLVCLTAQYQHDQYERAMHHVCLHGGDYDVPGIVTIKAGRVKLPFRHLNLSTGGGRLPFGAKRYGWFARSYAGTGDGTLRATYDVLGAELEGVFDFDYRTAFPNDPAGIYRGRILPIDASGNPVASSECYPPFRFWIDPDGTAKNVPLEIAQTGSFEWSHEADPYSLNLPPTYHAVVRPKRPMLAHPLPANVTPFPPLPSGTPKAQLSRINLGPAMDQGNRWYPCITDRGIQVTENTQGYYFSQGPNDFLSPYPILPLVDGPRNVATYGYTTDVWQGRDRKFYHATPYSRRVVDSRGEVRTLFGLYSQYPAYWEDLAAAATKGVLHPSLAIRGIWPNTTRPRAQQFPLRSWFEFFLPTTVVQGTGTPVQDATMVVAESPHPVGINPTSVVGDDHGWILEVVYDGTDHTKEPTVYERFAVNRPFGGKLHTDGLLYVAERGKHRVLAIDPTTWQLVRVVIDGGAAAAALGSINAADDTFRLLPGKTTADARAVKCVDPTGLDIAGDWLYVGSRPMGGVFRVNLRDGTWQWARDVSVTDIQSHFVNVRVMADHTLFTCTFDNQYLGHPRAAVLSPDATQTHSQAWDWAYFGYDQVQGVGSTGTLVDIYPMSMSVTKDAIAVGGSQESLAVFVKRDPSEVIPPAAAMKAGHHEYNGAGLYLLYGRMGMGQEVPPAGLTPNSDAWLTANGVVPGAQATPPVQPPPVTPPPITGSSMFKSVTKVQTGTYPPLPTQGQRAVWRMHGSGGGWDTTRTDPTLPQQDYYNGDQWDGVTDTFAPDQHYDLHAYSGGAYGSTLTPPNPVPYTVFAPVDRSVLGQGRNSETLHLGYTRGTSKVFSDYTMRAYTAWRAWAPTQYPQADFSKGVVIHDTNSMGAWASLIAMRQPDIVAVYATQPRWKATSVADWEANVASGAVPAGLLCDDGVAFAARYDSIAYVSDRNNRLPPLFWTVATSDNFTPIADHKAAVAAIQARNRDPQTTNAQRVQFSFKWVPGVHGASGTAIPGSNTTPGPDYPDWRLFELGKGYPVFDRCSLDDDINAATGWINRGLLFGNVVESASGFACDVWCTRGACDVDVSVHSDVFTGKGDAQRISIPAGQRVTVSFPATLQAPPPDPVISNVTVTPSAEALGGPVKINATLANATALTLNGQPVTLPATVTPTSAADTFTLIAMGAPGTTSAQVIIGRPGWSA